MSSKYYLSSVAERDIDEVITYLAEENLNAAYDFLDSLYDAMGKLAENPYMGHHREDLTDKPVRFWTFKWHYLIVYKLVSPIEIVRILSGYRDLAHLIN